MSDNRLLTNARLRRLMLAVQDIMGLGGLLTILRHAGLQRYAAALPENNQETGPYASEYAALIQAIENYYGRGARSTLTRLGYAVFNRFIESQHLPLFWHKLLLKVQPLAMRRTEALKWVAQDLANPNGKVLVKTENQRLLLLDYESDATNGRTRNTEICWTTLGQIQEALKWTTGQEYEVTEVSCKAKGDPVCCFEIGDALG